jgi:hypothetical protein
MRRQLIGVAVLMTMGCSQSKPTTFEASMNFDSEHVQPFLEQLNANLGLRLPVSKLVEFTLSTEIEDERSTTFDLVFKGSKSQIEYGVFMDDVDAPDLSFWTSSSELARAIDSQMEIFADAHDM